MEYIQNLINDLNSNEAIVKWTALLTIATFLLFVAAVSQEKIKNLIYKPKLNCRIVMKTPDCHLLNSNDTYYFRFRIENNGNFSAKNVEVIIKDVKDANNSKIELSQDNLLWSSHYKEAVAPDRLWSLKERMYWDYISPSTYQYCNLGSVSKPSTKHPNMKFALSVYWPSPDGKNILGNGSYTFEVIVGCENGKTISRRFKLEFNLLPGEWYDNDSEFLKKLNIKEIK